MTWLDEQINGISNTHQISNLGGWVQKINTIRNGQQIGEGLFKINMDDL